MPRNTSEILLLDGAMGSLLERCGSDTTLPLWSARALIESPHLVDEIHRRYLDAGAQLITTNTFRTHRRSLTKAGRGDEARTLTLRAIELAQRARDFVNQDAKVCGSVSPLEDCYEPDAAPGRTECEDEHGAMIDALVAGGVDYLLIETMNNLTEAKAAASIAAQRMPGEYILSACMKHDARKPTLLSGERAIDLFKSAEHAFAIGVNCVSAAAIEGTLRALRKTYPAHRLIAYANVGRPDANQGWINTDAIDPARYAEYAARWIDAGAMIIGGCCGTVPETIRAIRNMIDARIEHSPSVAQDLDG